MDHPGQFTGERRSFIDRMFAAAKLDPSVFNEVEHDLSATGQAAGVVCMAAVASALGGLGASGINVVVGLVASLVGWLLWAGVTYLVGDKLLGGTAAVASALGGLGASGGRPGRAPRRVAPLGGSYLPRGGQAPGWGKLGGASPNSGLRSGAGRPLCRGCPSAHRLARPGGGRRVDSVRRDRGHQGGARLLHRKGRSHRFDRVVLPDNPLPPLRHPRSSEWVSHACALSSR